MASHGGAREGAGRPRKAEFEPVPEPQTPLMWLWQELERLYGKADIDTLHLRYNERNQAYQKAQIAKQRERRKQMEQAELARQAWKSNEINTATDLMDEAHIDIFLGEN